MSARPSPALAGAFSRRTLLVAAAAGTAALAAGCTGSAGDDPADAVTQAQVDQLATQVRVQEQLVADYAAAFAAAPQLATSAAGLAAQAGEQLARLRAAAPGTAPSAGAPTTAGTQPAPAVPADGAAAWLQARVAAAADAHTLACPDFTGGRAALLGSIAAGLRAQAGQLA